MEQTADEIKRLQSCINDLVSLLALPAIWGGHESSQIVGTLLDVLLGMLRLDVAYARLSDAIDGSPIEVVRLAQRQNLGAQPQEVSRALHRCLADDPPTLPFVVPNPIGAGEISIAPLRLGLQGEVGVLVAGSRRTNFPTKIEMLLLRVAANQAAIGLQEARRLHEQRRAAEELERRVVERTRQLTAVNEELRKEILERQRAEAKLLAVQDELAAELIAMTRLHELSTRLLASTELQPLLEEVLHATIALQNADFGNVQLYNSATQALEIVAQHGFQQDFLDYFSSVHEGTAACGQALQRQERVIIEDVRTDPDFEPHRQVAASAGFRAVQSTPLFSRSGEPLGMVSTHFRQPHRPSERDLRLTDLYARQAAEMIERKRAEEALRRSQQERRRQLMQLETIYRTAPVGLCVVDTRLRFLRVNQRLTEMTDLPPQACIGRTLRELMPGLADTLEPICRRVVQTSAPIFDLEIHGASGVHPGEERIWRTSYYPVRGGNRKVYGVSVVMYDITERKRAEAQLGQSEERFRLLVETVKDYAIFVMNPAGHVSSWNAGAEHIKGYRANEIIGQHFSRFYPPEDLPRGKPEMELQVAAAAGRYEDEGWRLRKDGSRFWAHVVITALRDREGTLIGFSKITRDLTERQRAEEALRTAQAELAHATRVMTLGELTASIAHEVNQPLAAVVTNGNACLRWLARETPDLDEARVAVERMIRDANRASEVIRRVRALARKTDPQKAWLDINNVIHEVVALVQNEVRQHRVALQTELSAALPLVLGDRVQVQQVVLNLLLNGIEAMQPVTDRPRELLIRSQRHGADEVLVAVQDSGIGLEPQSIAQLFDAFVTTKPGGMGMGLSISRSISEAHGGRLWASPNTGPGATFQFTLPTGRVCVP